MNKNHIHKNLHFHVILKITSMSNTQDQPHNLLGPGQNENVGLLFKCYQEFQDDDNIALNQAQGLFEHDTPELCDHAAHMVMMPVLPAQFWGPYL